MHMTASLPTQPVIKTRDQMEAVLENLVQLKVEISELIAERDGEVEVIRRKFQSRIDNLANLIRQETGWVMAWADANPSELGSARKLECAQATIGYEKQAAFIDRASRRWTWAKIVECLRATSWGEKYLRTPEPMVDKDAIVADLGTLSEADLRNVGIKVIQGERFFISDKTNPEGNQ